MYIERERDQGGDRAPPGDSSTFASPSSPSARVGSSMLASFHLAPVIDSRVRRALMPYSCSDR